MRTKTTKEIRKTLADDESLAAALWKGIQEALRRHKQAGHPVAVWRDGKTVWIPAKAIRLDRPTEDGERRPNPT